MEKSLLILGFLLFAVNVYCHREPTPEERQALEECKKELNLPEEKPDGPLHKDPRFRCLPACMCKKAGRIKDGKIVPEKFIEHVKKHHPDADVSKITPCIEKANQETDECQVSLTAMKCMHETFGPPKHHEHGSTTPSSFF